MSVEEKLKADFDNRIKETTELDKEKQAVEDDIIAKNITESHQVLNISPFGTLIFEYPGLGATLEADKVYAKFKSTHLRKGDLLTEAQLKAIYKRPLTIEIDGEVVEAGPEIWNDKKEKRMEELFGIVREAEQLFKQFREEIQELQEEILSVPKTKKKKIKELEDKEKKLTIKAYEVYINLANNRMEVLELQATKLELFSASLEQQALAEKIKYFAPHCIKLLKDNEIGYLWKTFEDMKNTGSDGTKVFSLFSMFLRGGDVSFFVDMQDGETY